LNQNSQQLELVCHSGENKLEVRLRNEHRVLDRVRADWIPRATEKEYNELLEEYSVKNSRIIKEEEEDDINTDRHGDFNTLNPQTLTIPDNIIIKQTITEESDEGSEMGGDSDPDRLKKKPSTNELSNRQEERSRASSQSRIRDYPQDILKEEFKSRGTPLVQVTISQKAQKLKVSTFSA
jgi:hypothetical protein